jgi:hypothetical protein
MIADDRALRRLDWTPRLALAVFIAASAVMVLQQWLYHHEHRRYLDRERACQECPSKDSE